MLALATYYACAIYDSTLLVGTDSGADAAPPANDAAIDGDNCNHARLPPRPDRDDPGGGDAGELIFATQSLVFEPDAGNGETVGYDLDGFCTCPGPKSCNAPGKTVCDDGRGRDNSAGALLANFTSYADVFNPKTINTRLAKGRVGLLLRLRDYNGTANDTQVEGAIFLSNGTDGVQDGGTPMVPQYMGKDVWTVDPRSLVGGVAPPYLPTTDNADNSAYVKDDVIVASLNATYIEFAAISGSSQFQVELKSVVVTAKIIHGPNNTFAIQDGLLAGRWPSRKLLTSLAGVHDPLNPGGYLCGDSGAYQGIKSLACTNRDIASSLQNDGQNANCDALSFALRFTASPALLGPVFAGPPPITPCGTQWTDDCP